MKKSIDNLQIRFTIYLFAYKPTTILPALANPSREEISCIRAIINCDWFLFVDQFSSSDPQCLTSIHLTLFPHTVRITAGIHKPCQISTLF